MTRAGLFLTLLVVSPAFATSADGTEKAVTWTGWFSDQSCAAPSLARGQLTPNNPVCVKNCLDRGIAPVFVSEQAKAMFEVKDYESVKEDVGYRVEVTGVVDAAGQTLSLRTVKRLSYMGASCSLSKSPNRKGL